MTRAGWAGCIARVATPLLRSRVRAWIFLLAVGVATIGACTLFYTENVTVKLLPFDNKSELQVVLNLPEGSSLEDTERALFAAADIVRGLPEVRSVQAYAGTAAPFNFNGLVRHYYMRQSPELGDLQINLAEKADARSRQPCDRARSAAPAAGVEAAARAARCRWWRFRRVRRCSPRCWRKSMGLMPRRDAPWRKR